MKKILIIIIIIIWLSINIYFYTDNKNLKNQNSILIEQLENIKIKEVNRNCYITFVNYFMNPESWIEFTLPPVKECLIKEILNEWYNMNWMLDKVLWQLSEFQDKYPNSKILEEYKMQLKKNFNYPIDALDRDAVKSALKIIWDKSFEETLPEKYTKVKNLSLNEDYFEKLENKYWKWNGYLDLQNWVIELDNMIVLEDLKLFTWKSLLIHIWYSTWIDKSIEILTQLKDLNIDSIWMNIRNDNNVSTNNYEIDSIVLKKEEAILFSEFKAKNKSLILIMWQKWIWEIICSDEIVKILWVKKEECSIIQINK